MQPFRLPKLGADMTEGRLLQWLKRPGEPVARGEIIALIETDKANVDVESFVDGVLDEILVEPSDRWLPVGTALAMISAPGQPATEADSAVDRVSDTPQAAPVATIAPVRQERPAAPERIMITPAARQRAQALGIALTQLLGTGPGGRITLRDVESIATTPPPAPAGSVAAPGDATPAAAAAPDRRTRMRDAIAAAMARSKREIPHYYLATSIDVGRALQWMTESNAQRGVADRLIPGVLFIKAVALALRSVPELNGFYLDGRAQPSAEIHVGTAISLRGGGLVAPALLNTGQCTLTALMHDYQDLVLRARAGSLRGAELTKPTITVTSLGDRGVETVFGVIYPPQVALVGFGRVLDRPWIHNGQVTARPIVHVTLAADHRASDGHRGALFLDAIDHHLQEPDQL